MSKILILDWVRLKLKLRTFLHEILFPSKARIRKFSILHFSNARPWSRDFADDFLVSVRLSVHLSVHLSVRLSVRLSVPKLCPKFVNEARFGLVNVPPGELQLTGKNFLTKAYFVLLISFFSLCVILLSSFSFLTSL